MHFLTLRWHRWWKFYLMEAKEPIILHTQNHGCWWPGDAFSQGISSHGIGLVLLEYHSFNTRRCNPGKCYLLVKKIQMKYICEKVSIRCVDGLVLIDCWSSAETVIVTWTINVFMWEIMLQKWVNAFACMKMNVFWLTFHWNLFLRVQLTIFQHWFR